MSCLSGCMFRSAHFCILRMLPGAVLAWGGIDRHLGRGNNLLSFCSKVSVSKKSMRLGEGNMNQGEKQERIISLFD